MIYIYGQSWESTQWPFIFSSVLTATVSLIRIQGVMGSTPALSSSGRGQAEVGTVAIVMQTLISAMLTGGVEHKDVQHQLQLALR